MNFSEIAKDLGKQSQPGVNYILNVNVSDAKKKELLTRLFNATGYSFYDKMFADNSELFDSQAIGTAGFQNPNGQIERLSSKLVQNYNLTRVMDPIIRGYYDSILADAENEAFENAISLDRHPTLTRSLVSETCAWCRARAGTFTDPDGELFARHDNCDCLFITRGYNSRNGQLKNYTKNSNTAKLSKRELTDIDRTEIDRIANDFDKKYYNPKSTHKRIYSSLNKTQAQYNEKQFQMGNYIQEKTGLSTKRPIIVARDEFEKTKGTKIGGSDTIYRGIRGTSAKELNEYINDFKTGKIHNNYSSRGYGAYFSTSSSTANMYATTNDSAVIEAKILPDARILKINKWTGYADLRSKILKQLDLDNVPASSTATNYVLANDLGSLAALSGYDIIDMTDDLQKIVLVLNREKVVIPDD